MKLAWDATYLYAAYTVTDTEILAVQTTRDHADLYKDDAVELFIDPQGDGSGALSSTFWSGVDYGWAQFSGPHGSSNGEAPAQFYARAKSELAAVSLGMVPGVNPHK